MKHAFKATIYKTGINWCVDVPPKITRSMKRHKGRISIRGTINGFAFAKWLIPVKDAPFRLFVNAVMMKGAQVSVGSVARFEIQEHRRQPVGDRPMLPALAARLRNEGLQGRFHALTASRKREVLKYLHQVKTEETLIRNIDKLITQLAAGVTSVRIP